MGVAAEDLTARARIRDAAMRHFGEHGFERASIRAIAESAGVSSGLVRHHFGSKQALREACDEHLVKTVRELNAQAAAGSPNLHPMAAIGPYQPYLARAFAEGWAAPLFDDVAAMSEPWLAAADVKRLDPPVVDRRVRAAVGTAMALGVGLLHQHVSRRIGVDVFSPEGERLLAAALLDIYSHPMLSPEDAAALRDARQEDPR